MQIETPIVSFQTVGGADSSEAHPPRPGAAITSSLFPPSLTSTSESKRGTQHSIIQLITQLPLTLAPCGSSSLDKLPGAAAFATSNYSSCHVTHTATEERRHRRRALSHFFLPEVSIRISTRRHDAMQRHTFQLLQEARASLERYSSTHACLLDIFCDAMRIPKHFFVAREKETAVGNKLENRMKTGAGIIKQSAENGREDANESPSDASMTVAEKLLYVILRTSAIANQPRERCLECVPVLCRDPSEVEEGDCSLYSLTLKKDRVEDVTGQWRERPVRCSSQDCPRCRANVNTPTVACSIEPRCWLSPSVVNLVERSLRMKRHMMWSVDMDPVVEALLGGDSYRGRYAVLLACAGRSSQWRSGLEEVGGVQPCDRMYESLLQASAKPFPGTRFKNGGMSAAHAYVGTRMLDAPSESRPFAYWLNEEDTAVRELFPTEKRYGRQPSVTERRRPGASVSPLVVDGGTGSAPAPSAELLPLTIFCAEYQSGHPLCAMVFVALHWCIVGWCDPYFLVVRHEGCRRHDYITPTAVSARRSAKRGRRRKTISCALEPALSVSSEFMVVGGDGDVTSSHEETLTSESMGIRKRCKADVSLFTASVTDALYRDVPDRPATGDAGGSAIPRCTRGPIAMLQWGCYYGTLFLRLERFCALGEMPERRPALGSYGQSSMEGLRCILSLLRRYVAALGDRRGGPYSISFTDVMQAHERLRLVAQHIAALADLFQVSASDDWSAGDTIQRLSSATFLSTLYVRFATCRVNALGRTGNGICKKNEAQDQSERKRKPAHPCGDNGDYRESRPSEDNRGCCASAEEGDHFESLDVVGLILLAALRPLHRTLHTWLMQGQLRDPLDEFFIVPSHGRSACGFVVDSSPERLPCFISAEAANEILHAGVSLRVLRAAATHVITSTHREQAMPVPREGSVMEGLESRYDAITVNWLVREYLESLVGRHSPNVFHPVPLVDLLDEKGSLRYWRGYYSSCNSILLSAAEQELQEAIQRELEGGREEGVHLSDSHKTDSTRLAMSFPEKACKMRGGKVDQTVLVHATSETDAVASAPPRKDETRMDSLYNSTRTPDDGTLSVSSPLFSVLHLSSFGKRSAVSSRGSLATMALYGVVAEEVRQVAYAELAEETDCGPSRQVLREEYQNRIYSLKRARRLEEWKSQRIALKLERITALRDIVDELSVAYSITSTVPLEGGWETAKEELKSPAAVATPPRFVQPLKQCPPSPSPPPVLLYSVATNMAALGQPSAVGYTSPSVYFCGVPATLDEPCDSPSHISLPLSVKRSAQTPRNHLTPSVTGAVTRLSVSRLRCLTGEPTPRTVEVRSAHLGFNPLSLAAAAPVALNAVSLADISNEECLSSSPVSREVVRCDEAGYPHPNDLYVVADINDDEYFEQRVGPRRYCRADQDAVVWQLQEEHKRIQGVEIGSRAYQSRCEEAGRRALSHEASPPLRETEEVLPSASEKGDVAGITRLWNTNPCEDEECLWEATCRGSALYPSQWFYDKFALTDDLNAALLEAALSPAQSEALHYCSRYYLTLGRYTASYLTHKALQMALLPPYGTLYSVTKQLMDVCLFQSPLAAAMLVDVWGRHADGSVKQSFHGPLTLREDGQYNSFSSADALSDLNKVFSRCWQDAVGSGVDVMQVELGLSSAGKEGEPVGELTCGCGSALDFSAEHEGEHPPYTRVFGGQPQPLPAHIENEDGRSQKATSPLDFLSDLALYHTEPCGGFWMMPDGILSHYCSLFSTLLFWKTVEQLVTRTWRVGMQSGVADVFFFCRSSRHILMSIQEHLWHSMCTFAHRYRTSLQFDSCVLYSYRQVEDFTVAQRRFVDECLFAAMLTPSFSKCRSHVYGMIRQVEEVERATRASAEALRQALEKASEPLRAFDDSLHTSLDTSTEKRSTSETGSNSDDEMSMGPLREALQAHFASGSCTPFHVPKKRNRKRRSAACVSSRSTTSSRFRRASIVSTTSCKRSLSSSTTRSTRAAAGSDKADAAKVETRELKRHLRTRERLQIEVDKTMRDERDKHRRFVRDATLRRLRSFAGLTELLLDILRNIRDACCGAIEEGGEDLGDDILYGSAFMVAGEHDAIGQACRKEERREKELGERRSCMLERANRLSSLITSLQTTVEAMNNHW